jgi:hypothetical protein
MCSGAVGLVFLILGAVLIWYCTQFVFKREKSIYSEYSTSILASAGKKN